MINLIAAKDLSGGIGYQNDLLVKLPNDLHRFKELTKSHFVVQGRRTFESIGKPLPLRTNIILTKNNKYVAPNGTFVYHSVEDIIHEYENYGNKEMELWVIGGREIYTQFLKYADKLYITEIEHRFPKIDTYFPQFSFLDWKLIDKVENKKDEKHPYNYAYCIYERRKLIKNN
jgi:dihydrofolate reductase